MWKPFAWLLTAAFAASSGFAEPAPTISVQALFGNPAFSSPELSPDGKQIALILSQGDKQAIVSRPLAGGALTPVASFGDPEVRIAWLAWANDDRLLLSGEFRLQRSVGVRARSTRLYSVPSTGGEIRWLGRRWMGSDKFAPKERPQFEDRVIHSLPDDPLRVLVLFDDPQKPFPRVMTVNVESGQLALRKEAERNIRVWAADTRGVVRAGWGTIDAGETLYRVLARIDPTATFEKVIEFDIDKQDGPWFEGFQRDAAKAYVRQSLTDRAAIYDFDLRTKQVGALLFSHAEVDVGDVETSVWNPRHADFTTFVTDWPERHYFDANAQRVYEALRKAFVAQFGPAAQFDVASASADGSFELLAVSSDIQPPTYFVHETRTHALTHLLDTAPKVPIAALSPTKRVTYQARDGLSIPAYLTLPQGRAAKNLPAIVLPHGGPRARDAIAWNPEVQLFASRGFAVFKMNFRGSAGYGLEFLHAGDREWGGKMQDDVSDGVAWLVAEGIADPDRIGIYGSSYGGYAALMGLVKTPQLFRAGAAYAGVTDLPLLLSHDERYRSFERDANEEAIGDDTEMLRAASPVNRVAELRAPVLLGHGVDDERVHVHHSQRMAAALERAGKEFEYLEFPDEIHGFLLEATRVKWYEAVVAFFDKNLAAREKPPAP